MTEEKDLLEDDSKPPIFKSWNQLYWFVLILHAVLIFIFYLFTEYYS